MRLLTTVFLVVSISNISFGQKPKNKISTNTEQKNYSKKSYNKSTKERFIPVELFTGAKWDGEHKLTLKKVATTATSCHPVTGKRCTKYTITGPFKTEKNNTKIEWVGNKIPYYQRIYNTKRGGKVESFFTINNSKDGLVRIYDKRKQWGERAYDGLGSKFPLGYWKQGEVRTYPSRRPTRIEIIELDGPNHCLTFRWTVGEGKKRNQDNIYTFCPNRGFTSFRHKNQHLDSKKRKPKN
ncbi:hypothetical protein F7018_01120 [Tenacibaculum aiptasiae]|uniref:Uncharacterized protein n=1 Tax=Tenacibaculum aiptasiae TaxID=426481 RepID=A0A7J5AS91_9FLAO|nr:hypothetical protein [Tenacibaculum aiptasiae]KAB1160505.1 hypothetical protein F7018_01120 [Tenacibaculum aiptasiae]